MRLTASLTVAGVVAAALAAVAAPGAAAAAPLDPFGPEGLDLHRAWTITQGAPSSVIGYVEGGVNWHLGNSRRLAEASYLNVRELPRPRPDGVEAASHDVTGDGVDHRRRLRRRPAGPRRQRQRLHGPGGPHRRLPRRP